MWHVLFLMSTKKKSTPPKAPKQAPYPRQQWKGSIPTNVLADIREIAEDEERAFNVTLVRLLKEALRARGKGSASTTLATHPQVPKVMTDAYTRQQQGAPKIPAPPKDAVREIAESEEGWEGSDPKRLLGGTKVTI